MHILNISKDLKVIESVITDIFGQSERPIANYSTGIEDSIRAILELNNLTAADSYVNKLIELYERIYLQQNVIILGKSFSGKTKAYQVRVYSIMQYAFSAKYNF